MIVSPDERVSMDMGDVVIENPAHTVRTVIVSSPLPNVAIFCEIFPILYVSALIVHSIASTKYV